MGTTTRLLLQKLVAGASTRADLISYWNSNADILDTLCKAAGLSGGQTVYGGTGSGDNLVLASTSHATKGKIIIGGTSAYDEVNGWMGIGTTSPAYPLDVSGSIRMNDKLYSAARSNYYLELQGDRNMVLCDSGSAIWTSGTYTSDIRLKKDIVELDGCLDKLASIRAVRFRWIDGKNWGAAIQIGVIAQEVEQVYPELIYTDPSGGKLVEYPKLAVILLQATKELNCEIAAKDDQIAALEARIASIEAKLNA